MAVRSFSEAQPCLYLDSMSSSSLNIKTKMEIPFRKTSDGTRSWEKTRSLNLGSSLMDTGFSKRLSSFGIVQGFSYRKKKKKKLHHLRIVCNLGGQYDETYDDVKNEIINYLTYKAVKTVLNQLYEMDPPRYMWFHNFVAEYKPSTGKRFLQTLAKEKQELAERVMVTRLHLYGKWIKVCDHAEIYKEISDENLELMREQLLETIVWPSDDVPDMDSID